MSTDAIEKPKVAIVMPAYNAEQTLEATLDDIPKGWLGHPDRRRRLQ